MQSNRVLYAFYASLAFVAYANAGDFKPSYPYQWAVESRIKAADPIKEVAGDGNILQQRTLFQNQKLLKLQHTFYTMHKKKSALLNKKKLSGAIVSITLRGLSGEVLKQ